MDENISGKNVVPDSVEDGGLEAFGTLAIVFHFVVTEMGIGDKPVIHGRSFAELPSLRLSRLTQTQNPDRS